MNCSTPGVDGHFKTNFFAPAQVGAKVTGECQALHRGKRTMAWQTRITNEQGRLIAVTTQ
ncbi:MAG TPA: PaaI family thioesterase, partial [Blastocatellia bacterium]